MQSGKTLRVVQTRQKIRVVVGKDMASQPTQKTEIDPLEDEVEKHMTDVLPEDQRMEDDRLESSGANLMKIAQIDEDESSADEVASVRRADAKQSRWQIFGAPALNRTQ